VSKKKLPKILDREKHEFNRVWHTYHAKHRIPYDYDERDRIFESIALIFLEEK
jgi:hypothetical protein